MEQELEWAEAQKIRTNVDLVGAAKRQLKFLAAVDRNRWLYEGPILERAIYRYNACWLPLLAKYSEGQILEGPLVVPLDCEWVWHCHRLNPVMYKFDCEQFYGRILDNCNVVSSVQGTSKRETEQIWNGLNPNEPYDFDMSSAFIQKSSGNGKYTQYDLLLAIKRQIPFFYQVSRPHMDNDLFLEAAVARYKGFLHLIKRNRERSLKCFCVPTYDIDLIWHSHQLHPASYCRDLVEVLGKVLEHDDTDSDRSKGQKLDVGFSETTKQWEDMFGSRYWRAGAMYRGSAPSPITTTPCYSNILTKQVVASNEYQNTILLPEVKEVEVMLEFVGVRNLPEGHKGSLSVAFSKSQPDTIFNAKRRLSILSESGEKQVAFFHCQPTGHLLFELVSHSPSTIKKSRPAKTLGSASISLEDFLSPVSTLSVEKWLELVPSSNTANLKPTGLKVALSFSIPIPALHVLQMVRARPFSKSSCFFPLPGRVKFTNSWTRVIDEAGNEVISLRMRDFGKDKGKNSISRKEVVGIAKYGEEHILAEFRSAVWSLMDSQWSLQLQKIPNKDGHLFELTGCRTVKLFPGRKLEYEPKHCAKHRNKRDHDFMTVVEFSAEDLYGRAVALLDLKSGLFKVKEEWLVLPVVTLGFILSDILRKEGCVALSEGGENLTGMEHKEADVCHEEVKKTNLTTKKEGTLKVEVTNTIIVAPEKGGPGSGGCDSECGNAGSESCGGCGNCGTGCENRLESGGCGGCGSGGCGGCGGGGCGGNCGNMVKSGGCGGCGGGCGGGGAGGCRNVVKSTGCGGCGAGGCGGNCGNMVKSGGCGGCGGGCGGCDAGGCRNVVKSTGCGGCGAGGCGAKAYGNSTGNPSIVEPPK